MRTATASSLVLLAGCWGAGPTPSKPEKATILYQLTPVGQDECSQQSYIGPVAFGPVYGFAGLLPYQPQAGCMGGSMPPNVDVPVYAFPVEGDGAAQVVATAGMSDGTYSPRLLALQGANNNVMWLSTPGTNTGQGQINFAGSPTALSYSFAPGGGFYSPVALLRDADYFYVAAEQVNTTGKAEPTNPNYPCCGPAPTPQASVIFARIKPPDVDPIEVTSLPVSPPFDCGHSTRCLVQNSTSLIYLAFDTTMGSSGWKIASFPKDFTADTIEDPLAHLSIGGDGLIPVGFHATDASVVWARSRSYDQSVTETPACEIDRFDLNTHMSVGPIFTTHAFDCAGISTDDESVYFTINETKNDNGGQHMRGLGIGRVHLDSKEVETIRIGVLGATSGPRRVMIGDTDLIVVDPFTIARIPMSALDGQHDFTP